MTALIAQDTRTVLQQNPAFGIIESKAVAPSEPQAPLAVTHTSVLADRLQPPPEPTSPELTVIKNRFSCVEGISDLKLLATCCAGTLVLAAFLVGRAWLYDARMAAVAGAGLAIISGMIMMTYQTENTRREKADQANQTAERQHKADQADWRHQMTRWRQLYYCYRDGTVFVLSETTGAPLEEMQAILEIGQPSSRETSVSGSTHA